MTGTVDFKCILLELYDTTKVRILLVGNVLFTLYRSGLYEILHSIYLIAIIFL